MFYVATEHVSNFYIQPRVFFAWEPLTSAFDEKVLGPWTAHWTLSKKKKKNIRAYPDICESVGVLYLNTCKHGPDSLLWYWEDNGWGGAVAVAPSSWLGQ
jgi:hypothetical protein